MTLVWLTLSCIRDQRLEQIPNSARIILRLSPSTLTLPLSPLSSSQKHFSLKDRKGRWWMLMDTQKSFIRI